MSWEIPKEEMEKFAERYLGMDSFSEEQKRFLKEIKEHGVCVIMDDHGRASKEFQELTNLLSGLRGKGIIPSFQIVQK